jgi:hypothetical protein
MVWESGLATWTHPGEKSRTPEPLMSPPKSVRICVLLLSLAAAAQSLARNYVLVPAGDRWRYQAQGTNPGSSWLDPAFRALDWPLARTEIGYGDGSQDTLIDPPPEDAPQTTTVYFHKVFTCPNPGRYTLMQLRLLRDDGAVVYVNGQEIARSNMPAGTVNSQTIASAPVYGRDQQGFQTFRIPKTALRSGFNVLAVEVHQSVANDADLSFNCELVASTDAQAVFITRGPYLQNATPNGITVRWRTDIPTISSVRWGVDRRTVRSVTQASMQPTTEHEARITGLLSGRRYFYAIQSNSVVTEGNSSEHWFKTLPAPGSEVPVRMWVLGDSGTGGDATGRAEQVRDAYRTFASKRLTDVWLMLGDNAYYTGLDSEYQAAVFDTYKRPLLNTTLWSTLGNHETYAGDPIPYFDIFNLPTTGEAGGVPSGTERYYSFDYGPVHFVCLDSQSSSRQPDSPMLTWLENDLETTRARWVIAYWHHPPYSHGSHNSDFEIELIEMRQYVLPILEAFGVDLVLSGHSHSYERSVLIDGHYGSSDSLQPTMIKDGGDGKLNGDGAYSKTTRSHAGTVYAVCGVSGQVSGGGYDHPVMVSSLPTLGSMAIDVNFNRLDAKFLDSTGNVPDEFTILKQ